MILISATGKVGSEAARLLPIQGEPVRQLAHHPENANALAAHLEPDGVFALWSYDPPDDDFLRSLQGVFTTAQAHIVNFANPLLDCESASTVYVTRGPRGAL